MANSLDPRKEAQARAAVEAAFGPVINLQNHRHVVEAEAIKVSMDEDRLKHWKQNAVKGMHQPFGFPPAARFANAPLEAHLSKFFEEARELADDLADPEKAANGMWLLELMDVQQVLESIYRCITDTYGPEPLNNARLMTIEKNEERGYYSPMVDTPNPGE